MFEKTTKIKHNNYMKTFLKKATWIILSVLFFSSCVFSIKAYAEEELDLNQITSDAYVQFQQCVEEELEKDPRANVESLKQDCKGRTLPSDCSLEGVWGWVMCPAINITGQAADASFWFIKGMLGINIKLLDQSTPTYQIWSNFRNIANIGIVIALLAIIISHLTGIGINNYGIKKTIPKLIIAAILVNASYIITQILVDLSNIFGNTMVDFFDTLEITSLPGQSLLEARNRSINGISLILSAIMIVRVGPSIITALYSFVMPMVISYILMLVTTGLILMLRQTVAVILVIVSPIAFLSMMFPNTENIFKLWKKALMGILVMFPIIAALFGAGSFVSKIIVYSSPGLLTQILGIVTQAMPLVFTPTLVRNSLSALPVVGGMIVQKLNSMRNSGVQMAKNSRSVKLSRQRLDDNIDKFHQGRSQGYVLGSASRMMHGLNSRTKSGQAHLNEINSKQSDRVLGLSDSIADQDLETIMNATKSGSLDNIWDNLSLDTKRAITANGYSKNDTEVWSSAAMLKKAKAGDLNIDEYQAVINNNENKGMNSLAMTRISEQARQRSVEKGRYDTAGFIRGVQKQPKGITAENAKSLNANTAISDYLKTLSSEEIAKISDKALLDKENNLKVGGQVLGSMYNEDLDVKNTVDKAFVLPTMTAATHKAINVSTGRSSKNGF